MGQNKTIFSTVKRPKTEARQANKSCKKWGLKERYNMKFIKNASKHERPLMKHEEWAKIRTFIAL